MRLCINGNNMASRRWTGRLRLFGFLTELRFWDRWMRTGGLQWPEEFAGRMAGKRELSGPLGEAVALQPHNPVRVLDVGSGPITSVAPNHPTKKLVLVPTDALARGYDLLFLRHRLTPPVRTRPVPAERIAAEFGATPFHIVHARNTLDHMTDPWEVIRQMVAVCAPGGLVWLDHEENEGEHANYGGMHGWNFCIRDGQPEVWSGPRNRHHRIEASAFEGVSRVEAEQSGNQITIRIFKAG